MIDLSRKTVLVTGGTGSFGKRVAVTLLREGAHVVVFSRCELKQSQMRARYPDIQYVIGDVRDEQAVDSVMRGIDYVFHAAALKQVPTLESYPLEAIKTNVLGSANVFRAAAEHEVDTVVALSTDKAVNPCNVLGMTKALMERLAMENITSLLSATRFRVVRYGNVLGSRGSVVPIFQEQIAAGGPVTITDPEMTRFLLTLDDAVDLVQAALSDEGYEEALWIKKAPACTVQILADACIKRYGNGKVIEQRVVGVRPGEKKHETLVGSHEMGRAEDVGDYFVVRSAPSDEIVTPVHHPYTSDSTRQMTDVNEVVGLIKRAEAATGEER